MDYFVKDISLAERGAKELAITEKEMPGLMACRKKYGPLKPLEGVRVSGSLHMTLQTAALIRTLVCLGAEVRWASCNIFSTQDQAAAVIAAEGVPVFAYKGETYEDYWSFTLKALTFPDGEGPDQIVDDGGDATLILHRGYAAENDINTLTNPDNNAEVEVINKVIRERIAENPGFFHRAVERLAGVSEETTTGVHRLYQMEARGELLVPAVNVNDSVTKSKFDNIYGCRHSLVDGIMRAMDVMLAGKTACVCGYGDVGKGSCESLASQKARIIVTEIDPICALQALMAGYTVATVEDALSEADIFVTCTGNCDVITLEHMQKMKDQAIVCNIGHFDNEIQVGRLMECPGVVRTNIKPQVDAFTFPDGHTIYLLAEGRLVNLGCATGHPSFVMSNSFTNQILAQLDIHANKRKPGVYLLDKKLDEEVARLHIEAKGARLTELSDKQSEYLGVPKEGPFKSNEYRY